MQDQFIKQLRKQYQVRLDHLQNTMAQMAYKFQNDALHLQLKQDPVLQQFKKLRTTQLLKQVLDQQRQQMITKLTESNTILKIEINKCQEENARLIIQYEKMNFEENQKEFVLEQIQRCEQLIKLKDNQIKQKQKQLTCQFKKKQNSYQLQTQILKKKYEQQKNRIRDLELELEKKKEQLAKVNKQIIFSQLETKEIHKQIQMIKKESRTKQLQDLSEQKNEYSYQKKINSIQIQLQKHKTFLIKKDTQIQRLLIEIDMLSQKYNNLKFLNQNYKAQNKQLNEQLNQVTDTFQNIIAKLKEDMRVIKQQWQKKCSQVQIQLRRQLSQFKISHNKQITNIQAQYQKLLDQKIWQIEKNGQNIQKKSRLYLRKKSEQKSINQQEYIEIYNKYEKVYQQLITLKQCLRNTEKIAQKLFQENNQIKEQSQRQHENNQKIISKLKLINKQLEQEYMNYKKQCEKKIKQIVVTPLKKIQQQHINQLQNQILQINQQFKKQIKKNKQLVYQIEDLQNQLHRQKQKYNNLFEEFQKKSSSTDRLQGKVKQMRHYQNTINQLQSKLKITKTELCQVNQILEKRNAQRLNHLETQKNLEIQIQELKLKLTSHKKKKGRIQNQFYSVIKKIKKNKQEISQIKNQFSKQLDSIEKQRDRITKQLKNNLNLICKCYNQQIQNLKKRISGKEEQFSKQIYHLKNDQISGYIYQNECLKRKIKQLQQKIKIQYNQKQNLKNILKNQLNNLINQSKKEKELMSSIKSEVEQRDQFYLKTFTKMTKYLNQIKYAINQQVTQLRKNYDHKQHQCDRLLKQNENFRKKFICIDNEYKILQEHCKVKQQCLKQMVNQLQQLKMKIKTKQKEIKQLRLQIIEKQGVIYHLNRDNYKSKFQKQNHEYNFGQKQKELNQLKKMISKTYDSLGKDKNNTTSFSSLKSAASNYRFQRKYY